MYMLYVLFFRAIWQIQGTKLVTLYVLVPQNELNIRRGIPSLLSIHEYFHPSVLQARFTLVQIMEINSPKWRFHVHALRFADFQPLSTEIQT